MITTKAKAVVGVGALLALGVVVYMVTRPRPPSHPEEDIGIHIDEAVLLDPSGQRRVLPGEDVNVTVFFTNIGEVDVSPRFRLAIWDGSTPIEGEWVRGGIVTPGEQNDCEISRNVPSNWPPGWVVSVRLDLEGVGPVKTWESYFDIVDMANPEDIEIVGTTYFVA